MNYNTFNIEIDKGGFTMASVIDVNAVKGKKGAYVVIALIILAGIVIWGSFYAIAPGEIGVKVDTVTGNTKSIEPGYHFKRPFLDRIYIYNVKTQLWDESTVGASRDLQEITLELQVNFRPVYEDVNKLHINVGQQYVTRVLEPAIYESAKSAIAQYNAEEMLEQRDNLRAVIETKLKDNLRQYNIAIEAVNIKDIDFKQAFNDAVETKMIEAQKVKTAEYKMMQAEQEKKAAILEAEGEAERQRLLAQSASRDSVSLAWIAKWNGELPKTMAGSNANFIVDLRN
ncbi:MAG: prohibitin family protein [Elusimicrobiota bacterium]|jgi:regulator of protease activity HflC (stomatin/prohibitin superfamily)|nr:prohibitin family protein [Elusimicrobiota bacterium]